LKRLKSRTQTMVSNLFELIDEPELAGIDEFEQGIY
jgi:hypothetical protein